MHWRQSGTPRADASVAKFSQPTNSVGSILGVSKRADGSAGEVWGWGDVLSFPDTGNNKVRRAEQKHWREASVFLTADGDVFTGGR